jgi:hypothetical protein
MLRALLTMLVLLFLAVGLTGIDVSMIQTALAEAADDNVSSEKREERSLRDSAARRSHGKRAKRTSVFRKHLTSTACQARSAFTSLSSPHGSIGNLYGRLRVFRI